MFIFALIGLTHAVLLDEDCEFVVSGKYYDLSALRNQSISGPETHLPSKWGFEVAVCGDIPYTCNIIDTGEIKNGNVYYTETDHNRTVCWHVLARWDSTFEAGPLDSTSGTSPGTDGLTLSFANGESCRGTRWRTKINLVCDPEDSAGSLTGFHDESDFCLFVINYHTSHACATQSQKPTTTQPSLSPTQMPNQYPTYHGPQITIEEEYYLDAACTEKSTDDPNEVSHAPKDLCIDFDYDPDYPDEYRSARAECDGEDAVKLTIYNKTHCRIERESQSTKIGMCKVSEEDDQGKGILWNKLVRIDGCDSAKKSEDSFFNTEHILLITGGGFLLVLIIVFAIYCFWRKKQDGLTSGYSTMQY